MNRNEAMTAAMRKYREIFPEGSIPPTIEQIGALSVLQRNHWVAVIIVYAFKGNAKPYVLFHANVDTSSGEVRLKKVGRVDDIADRALLDEHSNAKLKEGELEIP
jgi:hypothetical protein